MDDSWIQREPSVGDISRTSHSDERYVANHYAPPMRQAIPIKAFAGEEIKIYILDNIKQHRIHISGKLLYLCITVVGQEWIQLT